MAAPAHSRSAPVSPKPSPAMEIDNALLRHRLFPRAMAYDSHYARYADDHAAYHDDRRKSAKYDAADSPGAGSGPRMGFPPTVDSRERLFRTIGKWLDQRPGEEPAYEYERSFPPREYERRVAYPSQHYQPSYGVDVPRGSVYDMVKLHHHHHDSPTGSYSAASSRSFPSPTHSHSSTDGGASKKRQRGPTGSTAPTTGVARPGMSTSSAKRCSVQDCGKIAVSKGLCRGHGGGRRCTFAGCTKCAQSRSPFCWAHGGGKRCEAPNCRRSRKTKRFCVDHVEMENTVPLSTDSDSDHRSHSHSDVAPVAHGIAALHLPSLTDALKRAVPAAVARASAQTVTLPQSRDRLWPVPQY